MNTSLSAIALTLAVAAAAATATAPAYAIPIADGTVSTSFNFNPVLDLTSDIATYSVQDGGTYEISASGGFAPAKRNIGTANGSLSFSKLSGVTTIEAVDNFYVFNDGLGGTFNFSVASVMTRNFIDNPGITTSGSIYLLGTAVDPFLQYDSTPASLTISFNSTGGSPYSSSATLAVPPASLTEVSEPVSFALLGAGLVGAGVVRRRVA